MARRLATIRRIGSLEPIEGRDRIELAHVDGWSVIVKKGEYEVGDLTVYCEPDTVLPERPEFEFLRDKKFKIKTMKMAGVISQGICFPMSILPYGVYKVRDDVTDLIGAKQNVDTMDIEKEIPKKSDGKTSWLKKKYYNSRFYKKKLAEQQEMKKFPSFIKKTDEERVQNIPEILIWKDPMFVTEKVDGQSGTFFLKRNHGIKSLFKPYEYGVCSRNIRIPEPDKSSYWEVSKKYNLERVLASCLGDHEWVALQGECVGPGIQGNKYGLDSYDVYFFNFITPDGRWSGESTYCLCQSHRLNYVPIVDVEYIMPDTVEEVLADAEGESELAEVEREGVVIRSQDGGISFKAVSRKFLLEHGE